MTDPVCWSIPDTTNIAPYPADPDSESPSAKVGPVTEDALDVLKQFQNRGFAGETRIAQTDQDRPRR